MAGVTFLPCRFLGVAVSLLFTFLSSRLLVYRFLASCLFLGVSQSCCRVSHLSVPSLEENFTGRTDVVFERGSSIVVVKCEREREREIDNLQLCKEIV